MYTVATSFLVWGFTALIAYSQPYRTLSISYSDQKANVTSLFNHVAVSWNTSEYGSCSEAGLVRWETVHMSHYNAAFILIRTVHRLLSQQPSVISLTGDCASVALGYNALKVEPVLQLIHTQDFRDEDTCCLVYRCYFTNLTADCHNNTVLTPAEAVDKVLTNTFGLLSWNSTCVLYDQSQSVRLMYAVQSLHLSDVKYIIRRLDEDGLTQATLLECLAFQTKKAPTLVVLVSAVVFETLLNQVRYLSKEVQGLVLISRWLIWVDGVSDELLDSVSLTNIAILQNKRAYLLSASEYRILTNAGNESRPYFTTAVEWDASFEPVLHGNIFPNAAFLIGGKTLNITTKVWPPFVIKNINDIGEEVYTGFCIDLLNELGKDLNFSYVMTEPPDNEWGRRLADGRWTGMMAQLYAKDVDMMVAAISIQQEREEVVDFTYPFFYDYKGIILRSEGGEADSHWATLIDPFDALSLCALLLSVPLVAGVLCGCEKALAINNTSLSKKEYRSRFTEYSHCLLYLYAALLSEGGEDTCRSLTGRTVIAFWWLFAIVVGGIYTGNLVATRTTATASASIRTINELLESPDYRWGIEQGDYLSMMFPVSKITKYQQIWAGVEEFNKTDPSVLSSNFSLHMEGVKRGHYAFFNDKSILELERTKDCENLVLATEEFLPMQFAVGLHEFSVYRQLLSEQIMTFHEVGMIAAWKRKWWPDRDCTKAKTKTANSIMFYEIRGAYYTLGGLLALSSLILFIEMVIRQLTGLQKRQKITIESAEDSRAAPGTGVMSRCGRFITRLVCCKTVSNSGDQPAS